MRLTPIQKRMLWEDLTALLIVFIGLPALATLIQFLVA